jgi:tetratricopeptide (TPR) repeat protein
LSERAVETYRREQDKDGMSNLLGEAALEEALAGSKSIAVKKALQAVELSHGMEANILAEAALGVAGDVKDATRVMNELTKGFPENTVANEAAATVRGLNLLGNGTSPDAARRAVEALAAATPYEMNATLYLLPVYVRGQAYLAAGQYAEARVEFQKILDHSGVTRNFVIGALAHLRMGEALAKIGDQAKARAELQAFLAGWKDADADLPLLKEAKDALAGLGK